MGKQLHVHRWWKMYVSDVQNENNLTMQLTKALETIILMVIFIVEIK